MASNVTIKEVMKAKPSAQANQSIIDGISVLQALAMSEEPVGSRELSRRLDMETTRVNRLLKTLAYIGITQQTANRKYVPGPGMHVLATQSLYASRLLRCAIAPLEKALILWPYGCIGGVVARLCIVFVSQATRYVIC